MDGLAIKAFISVALALVIAGWSVRRKSLNLSGGFAGFVVMAATIMASYRFGALLLAFFFTSSKLTKYGAERKRKSDAEYKEGGQRDWLQVLMNSLIATALALGVAYLTGWNDICLDSEKASLVTGLIGGILGHYACCNGDTWSSEIGVLSSSQPRLITTFKGSMLKLARAKDDTKFDFVSQSVIGSELMVYRVIQMQRGPWETRGRQ